MLWITLVLFVVGEAVAETQLKHQCPILKTVREFNVDKYMGIWYQVRKYSTLFGLEVKCVTANYTLAANGSFNITDSQISSITNKSSSIDSIAIPIGKSSNAKFKVTVQYDRYSIVSPYWVLATNYDHWAVVWSCKYYNGVSVRYSLILTRKRDPEAAILEKAMEAVNWKEIGEVYFLPTDQKNCPKVN